MTALPNHQHSLISTHDSWVCLQVNLINMLLCFKMFAGHIFPQFEHASRGLWQGFLSSALDALSFFKNTCRHRALNPLLVPRCVRCAVERRCWRISRNAILQGGKRGVIWGQRGGNVWTVKHFTFLEAESEHFYLSWERGGLVKWRWKCNLLTRDHAGGLNEIITLLLLLSDRNANKILLEKN